MRQPAGSKSAFLRRIVLCAVLLAIAWSVAGCAPTVVARMRYDACGNIFKRCGAWGTGGN